MVPLRPLSALSSVECLRLYRDGSGSSLECQDELDLCCCKNGLCALSACMTQISKVSVGGDRWIWRPAQMTT